MSRHRALAVVLGVAGALVPWTAAAAQPPPEVLARICARAPDHPHCATTVRFVAPTPADGAHVTVPFTLDVRVGGVAPVGVVRYFFRDAAGGLSSANREPELGTRFVVDSVLAQRLVDTGTVAVQACAYAADDPDLGLLACSAVRTLVVERPA